MVRGESTQELFKRLQAEMTELAGLNLRALQVTLEAFVSWEHDRMEIVVLCSDLLKRVLKHTDEQPLVRRVVCLLCRIAFRHPIPGIKARIDPLDLETLERLLAFTQDGDLEFIGDLAMAFASVSWSEELEARILWAILLDIPLHGLSKPAQAAIITVFGTARWSLVERLDREKLAGSVGGLSTGVILEQIVGDPSVCIGWMRLLLFSTFRSPPKTNARSLWSVLRSIPPNVPHFFSRDLPGYFDQSEAALHNLNDNCDSGMRKEREKERGEMEEALWLILFWSSRFFEMEYKPWSEFKDATVRLGQREPLLLRQLEKLCFGLEKEAQTGQNPPTARTKAYTEMAKLLPYKAPATVPGDTPPASPVNQQNDVLSQIRGNLPQSPTMSFGTPPSLSQPPPHLQEESEPPVLTILTNDDDGQRPPPVRSGSGSSRMIGAGPQSRPPLALPNRNDEAESSSIVHAILLAALSDGDESSAIMAPGAPPSLSQPPPQEESEPSVPTNDDGDQRLPLVQSGPHSGHPPAPPDRRDDAESPSIIHAIPRAGLSDGGDGLSPTMTPETPPSLSQPPPSQEELEPLVLTNEDGDQHPLPIQSGSETNRLISADPGNPSVTPNRNDETEATSLSHPSVGS